MARTPDQRQPFSARLRTLRDELGLTQPQVVDQLEANGGTRVTAQAYGQWEAGKGAPDRANAIALGKILGDETLPEFLGYRGDPELPDRIALLEARLALIDERVSARDAQLEEILRLLRGD